MNSTAASLQQARALHAQGELAKAQRLYEAILDARPDDPEANHLLGVLALQSGSAATAVELISRALRVCPDNAQAHANLGSAMFTLRRWEEALGEYNRALEIDPRFNGVHHNRGTALQMLGRHEQAADSFARLLEAMPEADFVLGNLVHARACACDWTDFEKLQQRLIAAVRAGRRAARSFAFLGVTASTADQLQCARTYDAYAAPRQPERLWKGERYKHDRIRVAYVSADFRDHIVSHLMAPIYEAHDTSRFETIGVSIAATDSSEVVSRSKSALTQFVDAAALSDFDVAKLLREQEVDIAVDLTGHTSGSRPAIFALRPCPLHVNYLGYPATMGSSSKDYILADRWTIPPARQGFYSEKVVYLPETFQANHARPLCLEKRKSDSLVLACFNNGYKLNPPLFDVWMDLLRAEPSAVLWLLAAGPGVEARLRSEAVARGVQAERLIFAPRVPYIEHLERLAQADIYLDTLPFNGGASASDALAAGVPVVTCAGEAFASRMATSLLNTVGMPELAAGNFDEYRRVALALVADRARLSAYRGMLLQQRTPLFDAPRFCRHLELAYQAMWGRSQRGQAPTSITVEAISTGAVPFQ